MKIELIDKNKIINSNTLTVYMQKKYAKRKLGLTDAEFRAFIIDYVNEIAICEILEKFSKKYRKEKQLYKKQAMKKTT